MSIPSRLPVDKIHPNAQTDIANFHSSVINEVSQSVANNKVVVVGMKTNPFVKRARKKLDEMKIPFTYLEYGGYTSRWKERLAVKMWAGFPTFPMVFVNGMLIGGATDVEKLAQSGELQRLVG